MEITVKTMSERCKKLVRKHAESIENGHFLPVFLGAIVEGGIELFDELRDCFEYAEIALKEADFTSLK